RVGCLTRPVTGAVALETFDTFVEVSNVGANWQQLGVVDAPGLDYGMVGPQHQIVVLNGPLWRVRVRRWQGVALFVAHGFSSKSRRFCSARSSRMSSGRPSSGVPCHPASGLPGPAGAAPAISGSGFSARFWSRISPFWSPK